MDKIFNEYYYKIYYWALKKTNNKEDAEDLTSNVFVSIFEYFNKDIQIEKIDNLIWKIAHNVWCTRAEIGYEENALDKIIYKDIIDNLDNINLTEKEKISFKLYYCDDLSIQEISKKINSSISNIKYYLYSARNKIKERYNG